MRRRMVFCVLLALSVSLSVTSRVTLGRGKDYLLDPDRIRAHVRFLADDLLEGRAPGTRGGDLAARYIASQFALLGLKPGVGESFFQPVPLVGITTDPGVELTIDAGDRIMGYSYGKEFVAWSATEKERVKVKGAPLLFVGYGVTAPEFEWNDYKGMDMSGKVLLMLVNDPPSEDPSVFGGKALTYYGRWTYKYEEAARQGAEGAILIHTTDMAGYPWGVVESSWSGEQFQLERELNVPVLQFESWVTQEVADTFLEPTGYRFTTLREKATSANFQPIPLGLQVNIELENSIRRIASPNVVGLLPGAHTRLKDEYVLYTTHYDHLGRGKPKDGDDIYNGAFDNASGTATMIEMARAFATLEKPPSRSILFAAVTAEESGLLGSKYYASHPVVPLYRTAAAVNIDSVNVWGATENIIALGADRSTIGKVVEKVAHEMAMRLSPDPFPEQGFFFRSDQFSLVKVGVPAVYFDMGLDFVGKSEGWGKRLMESYIEKTYHQPADEYHPDWPFEGSAQVGTFAVKTGLALSNAGTMPRWHKGDPFASVREVSLQQGNR